MAPKRDLDDLEDGEFSFTTDHIITKRCKVYDSSLNDKGVDSPLNNQGNTLIHSFSAKSQIPTESTSSTNPPSKKRNFDNLDSDGDGVAFNDNHVVSKRLKLLSSYREKEFIPLNVEAEPNDTWCARIANELTEYIPPSPGEESESSSWSTSIEDEIAERTPSPETFSDDTHVDEDMMDVDVVVSGPYDPTEGIYDAILQPKTKDGTLKVMRERCLEILQILNAERSKKYPSLWLRSLCQILHAVVIAAERSLISWQLTHSEKEDFQKIAAVMDDIASIMPEWNKPNFPVKLLRNVNVRFWSSLQLPGLLEKAISRFGIDSALAEDAECFATQPPAYDYSRFFTPQPITNKAFDFRRNDSSDLQLGNVEAMSF